MTDSTAGSTVGMHPAVSRPVLRSGKVHAGQDEEQGASEGSEQDSSEPATEASLAEADEAGQSYEEVEFQGCGVPSAFADPGAFEGADEADVAPDRDRLTDLPKLPLQPRASLRVRVMQTPDAANGWPYLTLCHGFLNILSCQSPV